MANDLNFESLALYGSVLHKLHTFKRPFKLEICALYLMVLFIRVWMDKNFMQIISLNDYHCNLVLCIVFYD
jgi:hypothetical protein